MIDNKVNLPIKQCC